MKLMIEMLSIRLLACCILLKLSLGKENVQLDIAQGTLKGLKTTTVYHAVPFYSFKGIPYAKPNVGRNKFDVAESLTSWSGILDATKHGSTCPFYCHVKQDIVGNEDCLFINVYTPDLNKDAKRAVMVFIHGGGFFSGSGNDMLFGPDFLVENDIVLVTMNYRLGVIGFLNTGDASAPGNVGLKDQNLALKWVQENIMNFGGCPKRVTIFGQGSGATSVHYHMLSPMSQGLFKGVILQSGAAVSPWAITYTPKDNAMALAEFLELKITDTKDLVEKLKDIDGRDLAAAAVELMITGDIAENGFVPSVENDVGQDMFLSDDPWMLMKYGDIVDVPMMIGLTRDESRFMTEGIMTKAAEYQDHMCKFIPSDLNITDPALRKGIAEIFSEFYFNKEPINQNAQALTQLLGDSAYNHGPLLSAGIMNSRMSSPVYKYLFDYFTSHGILKNLTEVEEGIVHCDDLVFLFYSNYLNNLPKLNSHDAKITDEMVEMWTNFAKEGDPSTSMKVAKIKWEPMGEDDKYLDISDELAMKNSLFKERVMLWANLYSDVLEDYAKLFN